MVKGTSPARHNVSRHPKNDRATKAVDNLDSKTERKRFKNRKFA
jgi:hypothetical protein